MTDTPLPLDEAAAKIQRAREEVFGLCSGKRKWTMRVPVDSERDSDFVICDALDVADALRARVSELEAERDGYRNGQVQVQALFDGLWKSHCALSAHANRLRDALVKARDMLCEDGDWLPGTTRANECITDALISTPAADLSAHDAEVLTLAFNELSRLGAFVPGGMDMARALAAQECNDA